MTIENALLQKAIAGFYYVSDGKTVYECKARGIFRKDGVKPLVGDRVTAEIDENGAGTIEKISPRKNSLVRPPIANLDCLFIVVSTVQPSPSTLTIDKLTAIAEDKGIEPVIVISKTDLSEGQTLYDIYSQAGIKAFMVSSETGEGCEAVGEEMVGKICAFTGNSGVGKSSLLNRLFPNLSLATGEISDKLGRGRHTTRHAELFNIFDSGPFFKNNGSLSGYVADTPGFSSVDIQEYEVVIKENLQFAFREFIPYLGKCKFSSCVHDKESGCAVKQAVDETVPRSRYDNYIRLFREMPDKNI